MQLAFYDYAIEHCAGARMQHVDALSRVGSICVVRDAFLERLTRAEQ